MAFFAVIPAAHADNLSSSSTSTATATAIAHGGAGGSAIVNVETGCRETDAAFDALGKMGVGVKNDDRIDAMLQHCDILRGWAKAVDASGQVFLLSPQDAKTYARGGEVTLANSIITSRPLTPKEAGYTKCEMVDGNIHIAYALFADEARALAACKRSLGY